MTQVWLIHVELHRHFEWLSAQNDVVSKTTLAPAQTLILTFNFGSNLGP